MNAEPTPGPPWRRLVERYLDHLAVERGLSGNSVAAYRRDLVRLGAALAEEGRDLATARPTDLSAQVRRMRREGLSPRSIARAISALALDDRGLDRARVVAVRAESGATIVVRSCSCFPQVS